MIAASPTVVAAERAAALVRAGRDVALLTAGEPELMPPAYVVAAAQAAAAERSRYPAAAGEPELRAAAAERTSQDEGASFSPEQLVITAGAKQAVWSALFLLARGLRVAVPRPGWPTFGELVTAAGGTAVPWDEGAPLPPCDAAILNSPANPTGRALDVAAYARLAPALGALRFVLCDRIYARLWFGENDRAPGLLEVAPELAARTLVVSGVSKAYAMAGFRIGWVAAPAPWARELAALQSQLVGGPALVSQRAALAALTGPQQFVAAAAALYRARRDRARAALSATLPCGAPDGGLYLWADARAAIRARGLAGSAALADALLERAGVAVMPGAAFGVEGFLRISLTQPDARLDEGIRRLCAFIHGA